MREREWLGCWTQRTGRKILDWWDGDRYLGLTEASYAPRPTPWLFRGDNGPLALAVLCVIALIWIWA